MNVSRKKVLRSDWEKLKSKMEGYESKCKGHGSEGGEGGSFMGVKKLYNIGRVGVTRREHKVRERKNKVEVKGRESNNNSI